MFTPGPPYPELTGLLANSVAVGPVRVEFTSDRLAAFVEAQLRGRTFTYGTLVRALDNTSYHSTSATDPNNRPHMLVRYVLPPTPPAP